MCVRGRRRPKWAGSVRQEEAPPASLADIGFSSGSERDDVRADGGEPDSHACFRPTVFSLRSAHGGPTADAWRPTDPEASPADTHCRFPNALKLRGVRSCFRFLGAPMGSDLDFCLPTRIWSRPRGQTLLFVDKVEAPGSDLNGTVVRQKQAIWELRASSLASLDHRHLTQV